MFAPGSRGASYVLHSQDVLMKYEVSTAATVIVALVVAASAGCREGSGQASTKEASSAGDVSLPVVSSDTNPISALKGMGAYLQSLKSFTVDVNATKEQAIDDDQNVQLAGTVHYLVQAPNL